MKGIHTNKESHLGLVCKSYLIKYFRWDPKTNTQIIKIRDGTEYEELIGVRRYWKHPFRFDGAYYDITIMELGMFYHSTMREF